MPISLKWNFVEPLRSAVLATVRKISARLQLSVVSPTCQIGNIRELVGRLGVPNGTFVEVGAFDGERFSNTSWLADDGWRGLYVEPSPLFARLCSIRHVFNQVAVVNVAAGGENGEAQFTEIGALSSLSGNTLSAYEGIDWARGILRRGRKIRSVPIRMLNDILQEHGIESGFELLVVDVEGFEESVFSGFDISQWKPRMVIVELCDVHPDFQSKPELAEPARRVREHILGAGYKAVWQDEINTVFSVL